ncbi:hypothetical protein HAX54_019169 [Datura stramonium]|uniref:Uncharacterized protein n=1 Tax=Datura stramonium TaxID=4076 RepID=A0ABS8UQ73_DATST|nr:hypothetical protein [Datura stramonium]
MSGEGTSKSEKLKGKNKGKGTKPTKRQRRLINEEEVEEERPRSPLAAIVEDLPLSAPQPSQNSPSRVQTSEPDFEYPSIEVEEDLPWRPKGVSEFKSLIQQRMKQPLSTRIRQINFKGDARGLSRPGIFMHQKGF